MDPDRTAIVYDKDMLCKVTSQGQVLWVPPGLVKSSCYVDISMYPFDTQNCSLNFASWVYDVTKLKLTLQHAFSASEFGDAAESSEWTFVKNGIHCTRYRMYYDADEEFAGIICHILLKRKPLYYVINMYLPCTILTCIGCLSFCLPPASGEKVSLSVTVFLALVVFMMAAMDQVPATSQTVPLIGNNIFIVKTLAISLR